MDDSFTGPNLNINDDFEREVLRQPHSLTSHPKIFKIQPATKKTRETVFLLRMSAASEEVNTSESEGDKQCRLYRLDPVGRIDRELKELTGESLSSKGMGCVNTK